MLVLTQSRTDGKLTTTMRTKADIEFHSDGIYRPLRPAVNVKVYTSLEQGYREFCRAYEDMPGDFTIDWIENNIPDETMEAIFWSICEAGWDDLNWAARDIWGNHYIINRHGGAEYDVNVFSEGRSGGWAIVGGINNDVDSWDAIEFAKWKRFAKYAKSLADNVMAEVVYDIYYNHYEVRP